MSTGPDAFINMHMGRGETRPRKTGRKGESWRPSGRVRGQLSRNRKGERREKVREKELER